MQESPGLKPEWCWDIRSFSIKNPNISLNINRSDLIQFNYPQICVSFLFDLLHYFAIWELYSFTSNYFPFLNGKNSTFPHSKLHLNIITKNMNSFHKCIPFVFHSWKRASNHPWTIGGLAYILFPPFIACIYLLKCQRQRHHTQNKQQWWKTAFLKYPSLHINLPKTFTIRRQW